MPLSINPRQALSVIHLSEDMPGLNGAPAGHTKSRHVHISKEGLGERMGAPDPHGLYNNKVFWRSAFIQIADGANALSLAITALGGTDFVRDFHKLADGTRFPGDGETDPVMIGEFDCRDMRGRAKAHHVKLAMQKHGERPHALHLITIYPFIPLP